MAMTVVVAYDISEDRRRARVAATLQQWGDRAQRSVYVLVIEPDELAGLLSRVVDIIDTNTDAVHAFRQCQSCWNEVGVFGQATVQEDPLYWSVL